MVGNPLLTVLIDDIWVDIMQAPSWLSLLYPSTNQFIGLWAYLTPSTLIHVTGISVYLYLLSKSNIHVGESAGLAGVSSGMGLDDGLLVCTLLLLI